MKRIIPILCFLLLCSGCQGKTKGYKDSEKEAIIENTRQIIEETLAKTEESPFEIESCEAYFNVPLSGSVKLTEYGHGTYKVNDEVYDYYVNTKTKQVFSSKPFIELKNKCASYLIELLNLDTQVEVELFRIEEFMLPNETIEDDRPEGQIMQSYFEKVLPIELTDVDSYLKDKNNRQVIHPICKLIVENDYSLNQIQLADFQKLKEYGIDPLYVSIENENQQILYTQDDYSSSHPTIPKMDYIIYDYLELDDFTFKASTYKKHSYLENGIFMTYESSYDITKDFEVKKTETNGFLVNIINLQAVKPSYAILIDEASPLLENTYNNQHMIWQQSNDGHYILSQDTSFIFGSYYQKLKDDNIPVTYFHASYIIEEKGIKKITNQ